MTRHRPEFVFRFSFFFLYCAVLLIGCKTAVGTSLYEPEYMRNFNPAALEQPSNLRFLIQELPDLSLPPDVGAFSEDPLEASPTHLETSFDDAYRNALLRGLPLTGVLGGDRVHVWPQVNPVSWTQNWNSSGGGADSWGYPGLVLAMGKHPEEDAYTVYTISGTILNQYGKSPVPSAANGAAGYGMPLGDSFYEDGRAVQVFSEGVIRDGKDGVVFIPGSPERYAYTEAEALEAFGGEGIDRAITWAFAEACSAVLDNAAFYGGDGPLLRLAFSEPWQAGETAVRELYIKTYDGGTTAFVLIAAPDLPLRPRYLASPFLNALLRYQNRLSGAEAIKADAAAQGIRSAYLRALLGGFALYGVPVTDPMPLAVSGGEDSAAAYQAAQRFSRGWMIADPVTLLPASMQPGVSGNGYGAAENQRPIQPASAGQEDSAGEAAETKSE